MAETNNAIGGESTTNTTTTTTGGVNTAPVGANAVTGRGEVNNTITKSSAEGTTGGTATEVAETTNPNINALPYPHASLSSIVTEASSYRDLIKDVYKEHERELNNDKGNTYEPSPEMLAARDDAQATLSVELRASLKAQRAVSRFNDRTEEGTIKVKLSNSHIDNGIAYKSGDEILVTEASAKFIEEAKAGKRV